MTLPDSLDVGVIIGRFQVPELHLGHRKLFETVLSRHKRVLVLLGIPAWRGGIKNPLDYRTRQLMIRSAYPDVVFSYIHDRQTNEEWSADVDKTIRDLFPFEKITLYGGRDGCVSQYRGSFQAIETLEDPSFDAQNGTSIRNSTAALPRDTPDFRAGVIYSSYSLPSIIVMCVDGAVIRHQSKEGFQVLLIRKPNEKKWRLPGGKLDPGDKTLESAVSREVREETGLEVGKPAYIGSEGAIPDWRGEQSGIGIASSLFFLPYIYGAPTAGDDAAEARWVSLFLTMPTDMEACHRNFLVMAQKWAQSNTERLIQQGDENNEFLASH